MLKNFLIIMLFVLGLGLLFSCSQSQTSSLSETTSNLAISSQSPGIYSSEVSVITDLAITFNQAITIEGATIDNFFTDIVSLGSWHDAGVPDLTSASLTFSADATTITVSSIRGWSSQTPFAPPKTVHLVAKEDKVKDLSNNALASNTELWNFSLASIEATVNPVDLSIFTNFLTDEVNDPYNTSGHPPLGPQYLSTIDYERVGLAIVDDYLYIYIGLAGSFEGGASAAATNYPTEEVSLASFDFRFDFDNNQMTGMEIGYELVVVCYLDSSDNMVVTGRISQGSTIPDLPTHTGFVNNGGVGYNYAVISVPISDLASIPSPGDQITARIWCEAESSSYHHFAFDAYNDDNDVTLTLGGE